MPMLYRGSDPAMRRIVQLSQSMDRQLAAEREHWTQQRTKAAPQKAAEGPEEEACCETPTPRYDASSHSMVCTCCGVTRSLGFEEFGASGVQIEQRMACGVERKVPYNRLKHFKKVLRDLTRAGTRVPESLIERIRLELRNKTVTRDAVRDALRKLRLYHYYTAENYLACVLGEKGAGVFVTGNEQQVLLKEAMKYSDGFDRLKLRERIQRRNFVHVHVLLHYLFEKCFSKDIASVLRLPSERIYTQNRKLIRDIEEEILFKPTVVTRRAKLLRREPQT